jgi:small conductance mechanosensitive channel
MNKYMNKYIDKYISAKTKKVLENNIYKYKKYIQSLIIFIIFYIIAIKIYNSIIAKINEKQDKVKISYDFFASFIFYFILFIGLFFSLLNADVDTNSILVILGSSGLAIALALQNSITQIINGLMILYFNYYELNDTIQVGDYLGKVVGFSLLNTTIETHENNINIIIPNNEIVSKVVYNFTKTPQILNSISVSISSNNNVDFIKLIDNIKAILRTKCKYIIDKNNINVNITDIAESGTKLVIKFKVNSMDFIESQYDVRLLVRNLLSQSHIKLLDNGYIQ